MSGLLEKYDFTNSCLDISENGSDYIAKMSKTIISEIINFEDDYLKNKLINYAKSYAESKNENIQLILLDEIEVKKVIDYGINEYIRRNNNG